MEPVFEVLIAALCAAGAVLVGWCVLGFLLRPMQGNTVWTVVPARNAGEGLEQTVRALVWLKGAGFLNGPIIIADSGLSREGRAVAARLARRWPCVRIHSAGSKLPPEQ